MKVSQFKNIIKEAVKEAISETVKQTIKETIKNELSSNRKNISENETISFNSNDVNRFSNRESNLPNLRDMYSSYIDEQPTNAPAFRPGGSVEGGNGEISLEQMKAILGLK